MCIFRNTQTAYGFITRFLHAITFILVTTMLVVGNFMHDIADKALKGQVYDLHKSTGLLVLAIGILFLLWSLSSIKPGYRNTMAGIEKKLARFVHGLLYFLIIAMPLSGWIMSTAAGHDPDFYGLVVLPFPGIPHSKALAGTAADLHGILGWTLVAVISLHILGALKHYLIDKDNTMQRIWKQQP